MTKVNTHSNSSKFLNTIKPYGDVTVLINPAFLWFLIMNLINDDINLGSSMLHY